MNSGGFTLPSVTTVLPPACTTVTPGGSIMENVAKVLAPAAPPPRPVPELAPSAPRSISTVSPPDSLAVSVNAVSVSVTLAADGPVKVTRGLLFWATLFRSWQVTPVALAQAVV